MCSSPKRETIRSCRRSPEKDRKEAEKNQRSQDLERDWRLQEKKKMLADKKDLYKRTTDIAAKVVYKQLHKYNTMPLRRKSSLNMTYLKEDVS